MAKKCYNHPNIEAVSECVFCGRSLCQECSSTTGDCKNFVGCIEFRQHRSRLKVPLGRVDEKAKKDTPKEVSKYETDRPDQLDRLSVKEKKKSDFLKLLRKPESVREAIVMVEILTQHKFRRL